MIRAFAALSMVAGGLALAGCSEWLAAGKAGVGEGVANTQEFNNTVAGVLYRMPGAMTLGAAIRTLTPQQLSVQIAALGGPNYILADECVGRLGELTRALQSVREPLLTEPQEESNQPLPPLDLTPEQLEDIMEKLPGY